MDRDESQKRLTGLADALGAALAPGHGEDSMLARVMRESPTAVTWRVAVGGRAGAVKLFDPGEEGRAAYARERRALEGFQGQGVPRLLFVADGEACLMTAFVEGRTLAEALDDANRLQMAEFLGQWLGRLSTVAPDQPADADNWKDYLDRVDGNLNREILAQQAPILEQTPVLRNLLAHNDNALTNFILGKDRRLYGVDFENARFKPEGWDLAMAGAALFGRFPDDLQLLSGALLRGYRLTATDTELPANFDQLISAVALSIALNGATKKP